MFFWKKNVTSTALFFFLSAQVLRKGAASQLNCSSTLKEVATYSTKIKVTCSPAADHTYRVHISYGKYNFGSQTSTKKIDAGSGFSKAFRITELEANTVYNYKLVESESLEEGYEGTKTFTTLSEQTSSPTVEADLEQTSSPSAEMEEQCSVSVRKIKALKATLSATCKTDMKAKIKYGMSKNLQSSTDKISFEAGSPEEVTLTELEPSQTYFYAIVYSGQWSNIGNFTTERLNATYWWPCNPTPPNIVLARPTNESVSAVVRSFHNVTISFIYGLQKENMNLSTNILTIPGNITEIIKLKGLEPNSLYYYKMTYQYNTSCPVQESAMSFFQTKRSRDKPFNFVVTSDTHWHDGWEPYTFEQSLENILLDAESGNADFLLELGDTFMGEKLDLDETTIHKPYENLFNYYSTICHSVPLYLVTGNHEGENGWEISDSDSMPIHVALARKTYFANPEPDFFYTGNEKIQFEKLGLQGDYYSWEWGNALFITLDPFWYTENKPNTRDCEENPGWCFTLGFEQYSWLYQTLSNSDALFKFIFIHNLLGGVFGNETDRPYTGAGGAEWSKHFEWGGYDEDGSWAFDKFRPGWLNISIHEMLVENNATIVFKGHDHFYNYGLRDGIIYQTVPRPSFAKSADESTASLKGYDPNDVLVDGGYLNVRVSQNCTHVSYKTYEGTLATEYYKCL